jgi:hypothetical protein
MVMAEEIEMKRCQPPANEFAERPELRLQEVIPDGRHRVGESTAAEARFMLRRAIVNQFMWQTERKTNVTLH